MYCIILFYKHNACSADTQNKITLFRQISMKLFQLLSGIHKFVSTLKSEIKQMKTKQIYLVIAFLIFGLFVHAQKDGYEHLTNVPPPHFNNAENQRNFRLNGILLSKTGKHLVLDYGRGNSTIAIFSFPDFNLLGLHTLNKVVELSQTYFTNNDSLLFVKEDRYAPDYMMIKVFEDRRKNIKCANTPRGCPSQAAGLAKIRTYTPDQKYLLERSRKNKSILEVYKRVD